MEKRTKKARVIPLLLCAFILCVNFKARAESLPQLFEGTATLADVIMSMYAISGVGVANQTWINQLYASYGDSFGTIQDLVSQGALVMNEASQYIPTQSLEEAISQASAYTDLGIGEMFNISASEAAATGAVATTGAGTLAGALGGVASTGVIPLLGGVTVAYWGGIAIGTMIAHALGLYGKNIETGLPIDTLQDVLDNIPSGSTVAYAMKANSNGSSKLEYYLIGEGYSLGYNINASTFTFNISNKSSINGNIVTANGRKITVTNGTSYQVQDNVALSASVNRVSGMFSYIVDNIFDSSSAYSNFTTQWKNGSVTPTKKEVKSPDLIGENGNLYSQSSEGGGITVPDMKPQIDTGTQAGKPLRLTDWLNFANGVKNNNSTTDPAGNNANAFEGMLDLIKTANPNPSPDPNPNPNPDPDPYAPPNPTPTPDPDYGDPNPDQPEWESETGDIPDPVSTGNPWVLPDITDKFPFCIPKDLKTMTENFKSTNRQAPHISWRFNPPHVPVDYTFNLDLSDFEEVATLLRSLELIGFVVGLAVATRYLIGAT